MTVAFMAMGIPGSGKTTILKPLADTYGLAYINRDDIRGELLGDATDQSANKAVWEEANRRTIAALAIGQGVILDSTFAEAWKRADMLTLLRASGADRIVGVVADVPLQVAKERNRNRERTVPDDVIENLHAKFAQQPPSLTEGFDALIPLEELPSRIETILRS